MQLGITYVQYQNPHLFITEKSVHVLLFYDITHLIDTDGYKILQAHLY